MNKIGASLASLLMSVPIVLIIITELILVQFTVPVTIPVTIPENVTLTLIGGIVSILGICVIFMNVAVLKIICNSLYGKVICYNDRNSRSDQDLNKGFDLIFSMI